MDLNEHIITFSRWLQIIVASTWLGVTLIYSLILNPLRKINISYQNLFSEIDIRYREIMNISVIILVISGVIITFERITGNPPPSLWFIFLSIKVSLAVIIMFLSWRLRKNTMTKNNKLDNFLGYNIILFFGAIIFLIASYLSTILENSP